MSNVSLQELPLGEVAATQYVYCFGGGLAEHGAEARDLLGNKGANLCELDRIGAPVPPGFVISTDACRYRTLHGHSPAELDEQVRVGIAWIEQQTALVFGGHDAPLLVSVRSGARDSMPGMMDTVLNVGASSDLLDGIASRMGGGRRFALDCRRRLVQMYGSVVLEMGESAFDSALERARTRSGAASDAQLTASDLEALLGEFEQLVGGGVPEDPWAQLDGAIVAVFDSWMGDRAQVYRSHHGIPDDWGTAVTVQGMVFGNTGPGGASGVVFTRDPASGVPQAFGEYLPDAQGEDVVSGARTPVPLPAKGYGSGDSSFGGSFGRLHQWLGIVEAHFRDVQDVEFTIEDGRLWLLQTRAAKRTAQAAVRIAVDLAEEGLIERDEALLRISSNVIDQLQTERLAETPADAPLLTGLPASPGISAGQVAFTVAHAVASHAQGIPVVLVREQTSSADVAGMIASVAVVTARGGMTSHAAVIARGMGIPCVSGCSELVIDADGSSAHVGEYTLTEGHWVTVDATRGEIHVGELATIPAEEHESLDVLLGWADERRRMKVLANADTPADATKSAVLGAQGIGLCRTEHMFFGPKRLPHLVGMLLAKDAPERAKELDQLRQIQRRDFTQIFSAMPAMPITIRLLDPPLHEFLPRGGTDELQQMAATLHRSADELLAAITRVHEENPMMGSRGIRLASLHPEIYEMQTTAIAEGIMDAGVDPANISIMLPLVMGVAEMRSGVRLVRRTLTAAMDRQAAHAIRIGTMIELPRACMVAGPLAREASFFSFGTNDLTQMTLGLSRDDTADLIATYVDHGLLAADPFTTLDQDGVGKLIRIACESARSVDPDFELGVCGEHAADPASIDFFEHLGLRYLSCSPARLRVARLGAAQAAIRSDLTPPPSVDPSTPAYSPDLLKMTHATRSRNDDTPSQ